MDAEHTSRIAAWNIAPELPATPGLVEPIGQRPTFGESLGSGEPLGTHADVSHASFNSRDTALAVLRNLGCRNQACNSLNSRCLSQFAHRRMFVAGEERAVSQNTGPCPRTPVRVPEHRSYGIRMQDFRVSKPTAAELAKLGPGHPACSLRPAL